MTRADMNAFEHSSPGRRLAMLHRLSMAWLSGPLLDLGLTRGRIGFLINVLHREGIIQEDMSRRMCIDRAATARALRELENDGYVRREEDPDDRRRKRVYPTDKARALLPGLMDVLVAHNATLFAGFSEQEKGQLLDLLDRMVNNMRTLVEENAE